MNNLIRGSFEYYLLRKYWKFINKYTYNLSTNHFKDYRLKYPVTPREIIDMVRDINPEIKLAIDLKDEFYELIHTSNINNIHSRLLLFINKLKDSSLHEYFIVSKTSSNWFNEISNSFINPKFTNGFIEGLNNKIKLIKRIAFGYRNFNNFKSRIFALTTNDLPISYAF